MATSNNDNQDQHQSPQQPAHQGYYYATPHQLYPYMSIFYSNVQTYKNQQQSMDPSQVPPQSPQSNMIPSAPLLNKYWTERNTQSQSILYDNNHNHNHNQNQYFYDPQQQQSLLQTPFEFKSLEEEGNGYWDLPKTTYGPLATNDNLCAPKQPRIGDKYQANIPPLIINKDKHKNKNKNKHKKPIFEDYCVWESNKISPKQLNQYLKVVQFVLGIYHLLFCPFF